MSTLRIGFIGCGVIAHAHAYSLTCLGRAGICDVEVASAYDSDAERQERFVRRFGGEAAADLETCCRSVDAVYVCTPTYAHMEAVRAASGAGRPIFCEKPLAPDLRAARALVDVVSVPVQVGLVLRTAPVFRELARMVSRGEFGRPMACTWRDDQFFPIQGHYASKWRADVTQAGAGTLLEHTIHDVDILRLCFGPIRSVSARTANYFGYKGIEDAASAQLLPESGLPISLVSVWHDVLTRGSSRRAEVIFERGFVTLENDFTGPITIETSEGTEIRPCPSADWVTSLPLPEGKLALAVQPYLEENRSFVDALATGTTLAPMLDDALAAHEVIDACYRSAATGGAYQDAATDRVGHDSAPELEARTGLIDPLLAGDIARPR